MKFETPRPLWSELGIEGGGKQRNISRIMEIHGEGKKNREKKTKKRHYHLLICQASVRV